MNLGTAWRLARTRPLPELPGRATRFLLREARATRRRWAFRRGAFSVSDRELSRALVLGAAGSDPLTFRLGVTPLAAEERARFAAEFGRLFPRAVSSILEGAENACAHRFDILGSGLIDLGLEIDWLRDFKTGFRWPPGYCRDLVLVDLSNSADVKVPWDLSRGHHLVTLGQAYWLTADDRYARELAAQLRSWTAANPAWGSVNWGNAMEAAIRIANWLWAAALVRDAPSFGPEERRLLRRSALEHGRFIMANLEIISGLPASNHYLSDLVGLVYLGALLPELEEAASWRDTGLSRLLHELPLQVREDGVDYECSTSYHRLVAELIASAFAVCRRAGLAVPDEAWQRLGRMVEYTLHYTRPDGRAPLIGDADDGRLHVFTPALSDDHRHLLALGGALLDRPEWIAAAGEYGADAAWWLGIETAAAFSPAAVPRSRAFPSGGVYVMRDGDDYLIADCAGPAELTGHAHNDTLGFELAACGRTFLVDSGTFVYTASAEWRNRFRGTAAHNTVMIDDSEMNTIVADELFSLGREAAVRVTRWESTTEHDILEAEHDGYTRLHGAPVHRRRFAFDKRARRWRIEDHVAGAGRHHLAAFLHFAPGVEVEQVTPTEWKATRDGATLRIMGNLPMQAREDWISSRYGQKSRGWVLELTLEAELPATWWWDLMALPAAP